MNTLNDFKIGDKVKILPGHGKWSGTSWTITKKLTKNVEMKSEYSTKPMRCPPHMLALADSAEAHLLPKFSPLLVIGTAVIYIHKGVSLGLYVVMGVNASGRYRIVKLNGDHGKYYTNVSRESLNVHIVENVYN